MVFQTRTVRGVPQTRPARTLVLIFIAVALLCRCERRRAPHGPWCGSSRGRTRTGADAAGADLGVDLHGCLRREVGSDRTRRASTAGANLGVDLHRGLRERDGWNEDQAARTTQMRPARTLVLIFMVCSLRRTGVAETTRTNLGVDLHGYAATGRGRGPHVRPARTLVLTFMATPRAGGTRDQRGPWC